MTNESEYIFDVTENMIKINDNKKTFLRYMLNIIINRTSKFKNQYTDTNKTLNYCGLFDNPNMSFKDWCNFILYDTIDYISPTCYFYAIHIMERIFNVAKEIFVENGIYKIFFVCLICAVKYLEDNIPSIDDWYRIGMKIYKKKHLIEIEAILLDKLNYDLYCDDINEIFKET